MSLSSVTSLFLKENLEVQEAERILKEIYLEIVRTKEERRFETTEEVSTSTNEKSGLA